MGAFDHIPDTVEGPPAPAAAAGAFDHVPDTTPSGGAYAAKELTRAQQIQQEVMKQLSKAEPGYLDRAVNQFTLGLPIPLKGLSTVVEGKAKEYFGGGEPATVGDYWKGGVGAQKEYFRQAEANTPGPKGVAVDVAGALAGGPKGVGKVLGKGEQAVQAFTQGAVGGAARNAEDVGSAAGGAAIGGTVDAVAQHFIGGLLDRLKGVKAAKKDVGDASRGGNAQQAKTDAGEIFEKLKNAGIKYSDKEAAPLAGNVSQRLAKEGFNPNMHHELIPVLGEIGGTQGRGMTWDQLRNMQTQISDLKAHSDPRLRRIAGELANEVDAFLKTAKPTMPASSVAAGVNPAADVSEAKKLYATGKHSGKLEGMAEVAAGAKDPATATQGVFKRYSDSFTKNPDKFNPNTPEQRRLIDTIGAGDPRLEKWSNYANKAGNYVGGAGAVGLAGTAAGPLTGLYDVSDKAGGTVASTLAAAAALKTGAGGMRRMMAERAASRVDDLFRNIATGSTEKAPGAYSPVDALAKIIAAQRASQSAGNYASSFINAGSPQP